jgi:restriction system protein
MPPALPGVADWQPESLRAATIQPTATDEEGVVSGPDLEELARDQIARAIEAKFKGHDLTRLVEAVLRW